MLRRRIEEPLAAGNVNVVSFFFSVILVQLLPSNYNLDRSGVGSDQREQIFSGRALLPLRLCECRLLANDDFLQSAMGLGQMDVCNIGNQLVRSFDQQIAQKRILLSGWRSVLRHRILAVGRTFYGWHVFSSSLLSIVGK